MADTYKLSYNDRPLTVSEWSGSLSFEDKDIHTLTLQDDGHGTLEANKLTGREGDRIYLSPRYNDYYRFNNYSLTGGTINGDVFTFSDTDATAQANFKVNYFTARGNFNWTNNFNGSYQGVQQAWPALAITAWTGASPSSTMTGGQGTNYGATGTNKAGNLTGNRAWKSWTPANGLRAPVNCSAWRLSGSIAITGQHNAGAYVFTSTNERTLTAGIYCVGDGASPNTSKYGKWFNTSTGNKSTTYTYNATAAKYGTATNLGSYGFGVLAQNWGSVTQGSGSCYSWAYNRILGIGGSWYASGIMP